MGLTRRNLVAAPALALALLLPCGSAFAAPPSEPPGRSSDAPGQQQDKDHGASEQQTPPGHGEPEVVAPEVVVTVVAAPPAEPEANEHAVETPRFSNAAGKPKHNVPAAAEAAPETSVSVVGNSGRHKLTICHNGHAITVDVHAARAHVDGHGDTHAVAGAKGRAVCPHSSGPTPRDETSSGPGALQLDPSAVGAGAGRGTNDPGVARAVVGDPQATTGGVSETAYEERSAVLGAAAGGATLPFTGAPLGLVVLFGVGLVGAGLLLRRFSLGWTPRRSSSR